MRAAGLKVLTIRDILSFGVDDHMGARVELEELATRALQFQLAEGVRLEEFHDKVVLSQTASENFTYLDRYLFSRLLSLKLEGYQRNVERTPAEGEFQQAPGRWASCLLVQIPGNKTTNSIVVSWLVQRLYVKVQADRSTMTLRIALTACRTNTTSKMSTSWRFWST